MVSIENQNEIIIENTYELNNLLHKYGIPEKIRSQFVGTCILALKNGLTYEASINSDIIENIKDIIIKLLKKYNKKEKILSLLITEVLGQKDIIKLDIKNFKTILKFIEDKILPYINNKNIIYQDMLKLFSAFNNYKEEKNQVFTPDHIADFMVKITGINKNTVVLDPCCGTGTFLIKAMTQALEDCITKEERENVKRNKIYGIEYDKNIYGLATTNMLIHGNNNPIIKQGSCFDFKDWIKEINPDVILMNPPYNAQRKHLPKDYTDTWNINQKEDPTKGLYFVKYIADIINEIGKQAKLAVILPVACAIGKSKEITNLKKELLKNNTLDAVFTLPDEIFYPVASVNVCCMVFILGKKHSDPSNPETFFGYFKDDGFRKKKNLGRIEIGK